MGTIHVLIVRNLAILSGSMTKKCRFAAMTTKKIRNLVANSCQLKKMLYICNRIQQNSVPWMSG